MHPFTAYCEKILEIPHSPDEMVFYRGVGDKSYTLKPGIIFDSRTPENELYKDLVFEFPEEFDSKKHLSTLSKMQHYGLPTRLVDLTDNPLAALFFAVEQRKNGADGKVEVFVVKKEDVLHYNSDRALMLSCLAVFSKEDQEEIRKFCESHTGVITEQDIRFHDPMKRFLHEIRGEYPAFEVAIVGQHLLNTYIVRAPKDNERIKVQNGAFAIFGLDVDNGSRKLEGLKKSTYIIPNQDKKKILEALDVMCIRSATIYPGLERTALWLRGKKLGWQELDE